MDWFLAGTVGLMWAVGISYCVIGSLKLWRKQ
jgi:hypothetical protein